MSDDHTDGPHTVEFYKSGQIRHRKRAPWWLLPTLAAVVVAGLLALIVGFSTSDSPEPVAQPKPLPSISILRITADPLPAETYTRTDTRTETLMRTVTRTMHSTVTVMATPPAVEPVTTTTTVTETVTQTVTPTPVDPPASTTEGVTPTPEG